MVRLSGSRLRGMRRVMFDLLRLGVFEFYYSQSVLQATSNPMYLEAVKCPSGEL